MKNLVLHIDDLGLSQSTNLAMQELVDWGISFSWSVMPVTPGFNGFLSIYKEKLNSKLDAGAHITLTSEWKNSRFSPIAWADNVSSLVDEDGFFFPDLPSTFKFDVKHVEREIRQQIGFLLDNWVKLSHVDSHMWVLLSKKYIAIYLKIAQEFWLHAFCSPPFDYYTEWFWFFNCESEISAYKENGGFVFDDFDSQSLCCPEKYNSVEDYAAYFEYRISWLKGRNNLVIWHISSPNHAKNDDFIADIKLRVIEFQFFNSSLYPAILKKYEFKPVTILDIWK